MSRAKPYTSKAITAAALITISGACGAQSTNAETTAIEQANRAFMAAVERGDAAVLSRMYTAKAIVLPPDAPSVSDRAGIEKLWQGVIDSGVRGLLLKTLDLEIRGDTAIETGAVDVLGESSAPLGRGKYVVVWKLENGAWKLHRDIWNMDAAPDAASSPPAKEKAQ